MAHEKADTAELAEVPPRAYRHDTPVARGRSWLPLVAVAAAAGFAVVDYGVRGELGYSPGPLVNAHATWDNNCTACHAGSQPLGGNNWLAALTGQTHAADAQCRTCHAGPAHHASEKSDEVAGCATCHRDHHGRHAALSRVPDGDCTRCHSDLARHVDRKPQYKDVTAIIRHPEFQILRDQAKDPGTIAFNHQLHLSPGMSRAGSAPAAAPFRLADIPAEFRERYQQAGQDDQAPVQLDCAKCHRGDSSEPAVSEEQLAGLPKNAVVRPRGSGAYMQPILYEEHCQACHPLTIKRIVEGGAPAGDVTVRHRLQPAELQELLRGYYTAQFLAGKLEARPDVMKLPLPGKDPTRDAGTKTARELIEKSVTADVALMLGASTCQKCHVSLAHDAERIPPARIPQVWYEHGKFDHAAHRAVACLECHGGAPTSRTNADVLLPGIDTCRRCHAPAAAGGGARFDCTECHRYHDGDQPLAGKGAASRLPAVAPVGISQFLQPR